MANCFIESVIKFKPNKKRENLNINNMTDKEKLILQDKIKNGQLAINELCGLLNKQVKRIGNSLNVPKECEPMIDEGIAILEEIISYHKILGQDYEIDIRMLDTFQTMKTKINYGSAEI